ncbi:SdpI family protein [Corynebacterium crudilactis]|uniref:SdpI family protein n=1 Tax=Corynebacterium crudilactis TaxID=1652495 RepID=A0A172QX23_9CORY|nr:SdpI family protein [Corynebacterium crudilactis]ANE05262.1 hypothetical protein ccrud_03860 [Corynebacterium crudilactis]
MDSSASSVAMLLFSVVLVAVVCVAITCMAAQGKIDRNSSVGIRTRRTQASDAAWQDGHAAALPLVNNIAWVAAITVLLAIVAQIAFSEPWGILTALAGMAVEIIVLLFAVKAANKAAKAAM